MKLYELSYFLFPEIKEEEIKKISEEIISFIQNEGGEIVKSGKPILKTLSYPIKKEKAAFLVSLSFNFSPEKLKDFEEKMRKKGEILRFFLVTKKIFEEKPAGPIPLKKLRKPIAPEVQKKEKLEKKVELSEIDKKLEEILGE